MIVTLAAAAAVFAGCGGGADTPTPAAQAATASPLAPVATSLAGSVDTAAAAAVAVPTMAADTGPIALADMDAQAQAEATAPAARELYADTSEAAKPGTDTNTFTGDTADSTGSTGTKAAGGAGAATGLDATGSAATDQQAPEPQALQAASPTVQPDEAAAAMPASHTSATRGGGRSVPLPNTLSTASPGGSSGGSTAVQEAVAVPRPINSTDIRLQVEANHTFSSYKWTWGVECSGQKVGAINIPEYGILGFDLGDGLGKTRFGKVPDPENSARQVLMFRPNSGDALVAGAPRCEMTFSPSFGGKLPVNQDIWFAFGIRLKDWVPTTDEQILMQWHWSNGSIPLGPFLTLALKGGKLQIDSKANAAYPPTVASTTSRVHWTNGAVPSNVWTYFVVKARISPHTSHNPYLKVWRDGTQIVNYAGPFGYNYPEVTPYVKIGHYQWVAAYNNWISAASTKTILVRTPALINDTTGLYTEYDVRSHVQSH